MAELQEILAWFMSGEGRLVAAAALFALMFLLERVPFVKDFLNYDGWKLGVDSADSWMTRSRKKLASNIILALAPTALMLTTDAPMAEVLSTGLTAALAAAGINSKLDAAKGKPANDNAVPHNKAAA